MAKRFDINEIINTKINYLLVLCESELHITSGGNKHRTILCKCDCGKTKTFQLSGVINNIVKSCGCYSASVSSKRLKIINKKHGHSLTSEYNSWISMKKRCYNKNNKHYKYYGARGIKVCERWLKSYNNFFDDMGKKPSKEYSLDRIDCNKGYYKDNCRWTTSLEQCRNLRSNVLYEYKNEIRCISEWSCLFKLTRYKTIKFLKKNGNLVIDKEIVEKGKEYFSFKIENF